MPYTHEIKALKMTTAEQLQEQIEELKKNQPLLVAFIKDVIRESISINIETDSHSEGDNFYVDISASIEIDGESIVSESSSVRI